MRFVVWLPAVLLAAVLWQLSATPNLAVAEGNLDLVLRKLAHVAAFGALAALVLMALRTNGVRAPYAIVGAALAALAYAVVDETHQSQVATRHGSPLDVAIDAIGIGIVSAIAVSRHRRNRC